VRPVTVPPVYDSVYDVAPDTAVHEKLTVVFAIAVMVKFVGAAGGAGEVIPALAASVLDASGRVATTNP
jgi:hypothetical protein